MPDYSLPPECNGDCTSAECYAKLLELHAVDDNDAPNYEPDGGPFVYTDLSFGELLNNSGCDSLFYFEVFENGGTLYSNVFVNQYTRDDVRAFPLPLMKAIREAHKSNFSQINFYWLKKSPQCPDGKDVLIKVIFESNGHAFYNMSAPPPAGSFTAPTPQSDSKAVAQSAA